MNSRDVIGELEALSKEAAEAGALHIVKSNLKTKKGINHVASAVRMACTAGIDPTPYLQTLPDEDLVKVLTALPKDSDLDDAIAACGLKAAGLMTYHSASRSLLLSPEALAAGHSVKTATTEAHGKTLAALGLSQTRLSRSAFEHVLEEAARKFWPCETPKEELERKLAAAGHTRSSVDSLISEMFETMGWDTALEPAIRTWLSGFAGRASGAEVRVNCLLLLIGKGGTGKTMFLDLLALDTAPMASVRLKQTGESQKLMETVTGHSIGNFEELNTQAKGGDRLADLKELVTANHLHARPAYGRQVEKLAVPCAWAATANQPMVASDGAEGRRLITALTQGGPEQGERRAQWMLKNRDALQAAAYWLYLNNCPTLLSAEMIKTNRPINDQYAVQEQTWQPYLLSKLDRLKDVILGDQTVTRLTAADLAVILGVEGYPSTLQAIEDTMLGAGWTYPLYVRGLGPGRHPTFLPPGVGDKDLIAIPVHPDQLNEIKEAVKA